ncbi:hypothetical protein MOU95_004301 [Vibrio vulnificus]|nr:hypothetical protein [Vibrio vulnificus]
MESIHTLNAREHVLLEVMKRTFNLDTQVINSEINRLLGKTVEILKSKNVNYKDLRNCLTPSTDKEEIILVFDSEQIDSYWYGYDVIDKVLPFFDSRSSHSVLVGDYLDHGGQISQSKLCHELWASINKRNDSTYQYGNQYFFVYINNLSPSMRKILDEGLSTYKPYAGYIDVTYASFMKTYASFTLAKSFIKHKKKIILSHAPDEDDAENINTLGYSFEEHGYTVVSINEDLDGVFLTYKIERPVQGVFARDTDFSINAISTTLLPIDELEIEIEDSKLGYLKEHKKGRMKKSELFHFDRRELEILIKQRLVYNYFYNLAYLEEHNVSKFNILVEKSNSFDEVIRLMVSLEYQPDSKKLRLITMV